MLVKKDVAALGALRHESVILGRAARVLWVHDGWEMRTRNIHNYDLSAEQASAIADRVDEDSAAEAP